MPDYGDPGWFQSYEMGHQGYTEFRFTGIRMSNTDGVDQLSGYIQDEY
jgi:hypothetical protein